MESQEPVYIDCPYCGEQILLMVDCSAGPQEYIEDCQVCCRPINIEVEITDEGQPDVRVRRDDD